jgi:Uma2 family endonuclease
MQKPLIEPWTVDDFLAWERAQGERYEFVDGIVRMMVGGTLAHARIKGNIYAALREQLERGRCEVFVDGPKVLTAAAAMYPVAVVTCAPDLAPDDDAVPDPVLIVEVLSRSTEQFDRGGKWRAYQELPSLRYFLLVAQEERRVEVYRRTRAGWALIVHTRPEDRVALPGLRASLSLAAIYRGAPA